MIGHTNLVRELKSLRKGRGVLSGRIVDRVGPALRAACEIGADDDVPVIRRKVTDRLIELAGLLPDDMGEAALIAFALKPETRHPLYQDRVSWAADQVNCDIRTIRRRVDEAIGHLAELAEEALASATAPGWHTSELHVVLSLDGPHPELLELHRVTATKDNLAELELTTTCPTDTPRVLYGGTLAGNNRLLLPTALPRGASHAFAIRAQLADTLSTLVHIPARPCGALDLRVRFGPSDVPSEARAIRGPARDSSGSLNTSPFLINEAGEIHLHFTDLAPGHPYGVQWTH
ncbi:hypothetical protein [Actinokineospora terrae]|uniref:Uncharacterized protein n=1 Tax=Actinokineospora terrae TaxID=155974 RepID=A0A1H9NXB3_9PSEU|nr:hypothetical protein [Actinokineospora terrae]SER39973.1 hypothetical protein SAMN04487818_103159 [Actinokineospora terrae]